MSNVVAFPGPALTVTVTDPPYGSGHRMLNLRQLCEWLNVSERHVRGLVEREAIPYRKAGHLLRFAEQEIEAWTHPARVTSVQAPDRVGAGSAVTALVPAGSALTLTRSKTSTQRRIPRSLLNAA